MIIKPVRRVYLEKKRRSAWNNKSSSSFLNLAFNLLHMHSCTLKKINDHAWTKGLLETKKSAFSGDLQQEVIFFVVEFGIQFAISTSFL